MESWDISSLDVAPHRPQVLRSDREALVIAIHLPAGEELQQHQTHERAYLLVVGGQIEVEKDGTTESGGPGYLVHFDPNERREVIVSGRMRDGAFVGQRDSLVTKCPSKFQDKPTGKTL